MPVDWISICMLLEEEMKLATCLVLNATTLRQTSGAMCPLYHSHWLLMRETCTMGRYTYQV